MVKNGVNETTADSWRRQKTERASQKSENPDSIRIPPQFYRSVGFHETFLRGIHQHPTPNAEIITRIYETAADGRRRQKTEGRARNPKKIRSPSVFPQFYRSVGFRGVPWVSGRRSEGAATNAQFLCEKKEYPERKRMRYKNQGSYLGAVPVHLQRPKMTRIGFRL